MLETSSNEMNEEGDSCDPLDPLKFPELVFGLIGPAGTDLPLVIRSLKEELARFKYSVEEIKLSRLIESFLEHDYSSCTEDKRIDQLMTDGTHIREKSKRGNAIALLAITEIRRLRAKNHGDKSEKIAYILVSLKHPHEVATLKNVYGEGFFTISAYSPRESRVDALAERIAKSKHEPAINCRADAEKLIQRDESETGRTLGQNVKDAFPLADLFVDCRAKALLESNLRRFIELIFCHPYHTPSRDEYGMFHAKSAALRSADLSRQVGAVIATSECDIIAVGCNDIPKFNGGLYWPGDALDSRDFQRGRDSTNEQKEILLSEIFQRLKKGGFLSAELTKTDHKIDELVLSLISGEKKELLKDAQIMNLLEFGRSVHAEMAALMDAARRGVAVKGATLYSTTFPCHLCARHIIAAGIKRVVYIEPYPKSRAKDFYKDSICVDPRDPTDSKVNFDPFTGIAPRQYLQLFEMQGERKDDTGRIIDVNSLPTTPRLTRFQNTHLEIETAIVGEVMPKIKESLNT